MAHVPTATSSSKIHRASKPKVRSGCITCKKRRVKCDERKPECLRCETFGCRCDGYEFPTRQIIPAVRKQVLAAKITNISQSFSAGTSTTYGSGNIVGRVYDIQEYSHIRPNHGKTLRYTPVNSLPYFCNPAFLDQLTIYSPSTALVESAKEEQYFRYYKDITSRQLTGVFDTEVWTLLFLRACHEEPFVRRAIVALGALSKAMEVAKPVGTQVKALPDVNDKVDQSHHHRYALEQYGKAIQRMREVASQGEGNIRTALISCLLTIAFENMHGRHETALAQINVGLRLMEDWMKKQPKAEYLTGLSSPAPFEIEDSLFHAFERLDIAAMHFFDTRSASLHSQKCQEHSETIANMPTSFTYIKQAGQYFSVVASRVVHFVKRVELDLKANRYRIQNVSGSVNEVFFPNRLNNLPGALLTEIDAYVSEITCWTAAFLPLRTQSRTQAGAHLLLPAVFLEIYSLLLHLMSHGIQWMQEALFDQYMQEYRTIVDLSEIVIKHPDLVDLGEPGRPFVSFDVNIVLPLLVVCLKCRDWTLRRRAVDLLSCNARREGTWDSSMAAGTAIWIMGVEEEGLEYGAYIPEERRARLSASRQDFMKRTAYISCTQELNGKVVTRETNISW